MSFSKAQHVSSFCICYVHANKAAEPAHTDLNLLLHHATQKQNGISKHNLKFLPAKTTWVAARTSLNKTHLLIPATGFKQVLCHLDHELENTWIRFCPHAAHICSARKDAVTKHVGKLWCTAVKTAPHFNWGKGVVWSLHQRILNLLGIRRVAGCAWNRLLSSWWELSIVLKGRIKHG